MNAQRTLKSIGQKIRAERKDAGYTQKQLADDLRVPVDYLQRIERGQNPIVSVVTIYRIARILGTRPKLILPDFKLSNDSPF